MKVFLFNILLLLMISGCAFAPFNTPTTGHTLGKGKSEIDFGLSPGVFASGTYGLLDNLDVGASLEIQFGLVGAVFTKFAILNSQEKSSLALYGGYFAADSKVNSEGYFVGPIYSYRKNSFEPFIGVYFTYIEFQTLEPGVDIENFSDFYHDIIALYSGGHTKYIDTSIGFNYWISDVTKFYLYGKNIYFVEGSYSDSDSNHWLVGLGFGFKMGQ